MLILYTATALERVRAANLSSGRKRGTQTLVIALVKRVVSDESSLPAHRRTSVVANSPRLGTMPACAPSRSRFLNPEYEGGLAPVAILVVTDYEAKGPNSTEQGENCGLAHRITHGCAHTFVGAWICPFRGKRLSLSDALFR